MAKQYITIKDIAAAGVSKTTVSRYLNGHYERMSGATKEKIAQVIKENGYQINSQAQSLTQRKTYLVGLGVADVENVFSAMLFKGADQVLAAAGYTIMLMNADNSPAIERQQLERLIKLRVDAIILQPIQRDAAAYDFLAATKLPVVIVDRQLQANPWPLVGTDNRGYSRLLAEYIFRQGYRQLVVLTEDVYANAAREDRYLGAQAAAKAAGCHVALLEVPSHISSTALYLCLAQVPDWLAGQTALYAIKGTLLMKLMMTLNEYTVRVPKDVGVAAFDDWDWAKLVAPQITTVQQDPWQMGQTAAQLLLMDWQGETVPRQTLIPSTLQVRKSLSGS